LLHHLGTVYLKWRVSVQGDACNEASSSEDLRDLLHLSLFIGPPRYREGEKLDDWLAKATASQIRELQSFVLGVARDKAAVIAGLTLPQNNGLVEGKVNQLKLIKRMGYGRAGFPLLRQRVLHAL